MSQDGRFVELLQIFWSILKLNSAIQKAISLPNFLLLEFLDPNVLLVPTALAHQMVAHWVVEMSIQALTAEPMTRMLLILSREMMQMDLTLRGKAPQTWETS